MENSASITITLRCFIEERPLSIYAIQYFFEKNLTMFLKYEKLLSILEESVYESQLTFTLAKFESQLIMCEDKID